MFVVTIINGKLVVLDVWPTMTQAAKEITGEEPLIKYFKAQREKFLLHLKKLGYQFITIPWMHETAQWNNVEVTKVVVDEWIEAKKE